MGVLVGTMVVVTGVGVVFTTRVLRGAGVVPRGVLVISATSLEKMISDNEKFSYGAMESVASTCI